MLIDFADAAGEMFTARVDMLTSSTSSIPVISPAKTCT